MAIIRHRLGDVFHRGNVVVLHAASQRIGQHLLSEVPHEELLPRPEDFLEGFRANKGFPTRQLATGIHRLSRDFGAPSTDRIEIFEGESQGIQTSVAGRTIRILPVLFQPLAKGLSIPLLVVRRQGGNQGRRGRGRRSENLLEQPFPT